MKCSKCHNTGNLKNDVFYTFCNLEHQAFCDCKYGEKSFRQWLNSAAVQNEMIKKRFDKVKLYLKFSQLPKRWRMDTLESLTGHSVEKQKVENYIKQFPHYYSQGIGIYIWSRNSRIGKTHLMTGICKKIIEKFQKPSIFLTESMIYEKIQSTFNCQISQNAIIEKLQKSPCLFIDDLGASQVTLWKLGILLKILDFRINNYLPTFFTSNYSISDYQKAIQQVSNQSEKIPQRISEKSQIIHLK